MGTASRPLRRDAALNREKLLTAASEVFAERGLRAPLEEIARRAGVSIGTLYNRFPTREALIDAIFPDVLADQLRAGEEALNLPDPWEGFVLLLERTCELQARNRGVNDIWSVRLTAAKVEEACRHGLAQVTELIDRAQRRGSLRADFTPSDFSFIVWSNSRIVEATADVAPDAWRRNLALILDGLRAEAAHPIKHPPMTLAQVDAAMHGRMAT
jgi:AcrR family transcriptional regulator